MTFPLRLADRDFPDPRSLSVAVAADARAGGGQVVAGKAPSAWLLDEVRAGRLPAELATGLCAAMVQSTEPALLCEGARLAAGLARPELGELLRLTFQAQDIGVLLTADPLAAAAGSPASVEDTLLSCWWRAANPADPAARAAMLAAARHAGRPELELGLLTAHGTAEELVTWLPGVLREGVTADTESALAAARARGLGEAVDAALEALEADARALAR